jgi:prepilin-type processing-associated H-X9-DG protein
MARSPWRFTIRKVIALIAVVALGAWGMTFLICAAQEEARRSHCSNNLKQIILALHTYHNAKASFPFGTLPNKGLPVEKRLSWLAATIPFLESGEVRFEEDEPWDKSTNIYPSNRPIRNSSFCCPSNPKTTAPNLPGPTHYVGIAGVGTDAPTLPKGHPRVGVFGYDRATRFADIKDGLSLTMMVAETTESIGPWTAGGRPTVRGLDLARQPYIGPGHQFGGCHRGGVMVAFADGSVRFLSCSIDSKVFEAISTIAGGEKVSGHDLDR